MMSRTLAFAVAWPYQQQVINRVVDEIEVALDVVPVDADAARGAEEALELGKPHHWHRLPPHITGTQMPSCSASASNCGHVHASCAVSYVGRVLSKASRMAIAPSPTAAATLLAEPLRTSPTAKTPGLLVSSGKGPVPLRTAGCGQRTGPGPDEAVVVKVNQAAQPVCARYSPDEDEERARRKDAPRAGTAADDGDRLQRLVAVQLPHLAVRHDLDVREPRDLVDEVARHVLAQVVLADDERDAGGVRGKEDRRLPRRVAAADDRDRVVAAHQRLSLRRRVVDAHLLEIVQAGHVEPTVPGASGDDHRRARQRGPVGEVDTVTAALLRDGGGLRGHGEPGAELLRLEHRPVRELGAGDTRGESEVVLDPR